MPTDRDVLLKKVQKIEDKLLLARILDKAEKARDYGYSMHSDFLDPHQRYLVEKALVRFSSFNISFSGGFRGAERVVAVLHPDFALPENTELYQEYFKLIYVQQKGREVLTHRDYLGALMGMGLKREKVGDILVEGEQCGIVVLKEVADYIYYNLASVGNVKVNVEIREMDAFRLPEKHTKEIRVTVASLRLDCVVGAGFGLSRSKISDLISAERVFLNWEATNNPSKTVKEGDTLSIRGKGRIVVDSIGGQTKKGRIGVVLRKLL